MPTSITVRGKVLTLSGDQEAAINKVFAQLGPGKEACLAGAAGTGKCLTGDTYVAAGSGVRRLLNCKDETLVRNTVDVPAMTVLEQAPATWLDMGTSETIEVTTSTGIKIRGTPEHPLLTWNGSLVWKRLDALQESDVLLLYPGYALEGGSAAFRHPDEAYLYGLLMGDGNMGEGRISFSRGGDYLPQRYFDLVSRFFDGAVPITYPRGGGSLSVSHFINDKALCSALRDRNWSFPVAREKTVPEWLMSATAEERVAFLQGLFDTDGSVHRENLDLVSASEALARSVQQMLLGLGVVSTLRPKRAKGYTHIYWRLLVRGEDAVSFSKQIGFRYEESKKLALKEMLDRSRNPNIGVYPNCEKQLRAVCHLAPPRHPLRTSRYLNGERCPSKNMLLEVFQGHKEREAQELISLTQFYPDSVVEVRRSGLERVFDFHVPNTHSFIANGIVSHNTTVMAAVLMRWTGNVIFLAPTGKAARRLSEQTGMKASTIHSAIFGSVEEEEEVPNAPRQERRREIIRFGDPHPPSGCYARTLVVVDESSMVDENLALTLRTQVFSVHGALLWVGDHEQLPPVEGKWGAPLQDATATLTEVHRQALDSPVLELATLIRQGKANTFTQWGGAVDRLPWATVEQAVAWMEEGREAAALLKFVPAEERAECKNAVRVLLTWTNAVRIRANRLVRESRGYPKADVQVGETLVCTMNKHGLGIMNGETFEVRKVELCEELTKVIGETIQWVTEVQEVESIPARRFLVMPRAFDVQDKNMYEKEILREAWRPLWAKDKAERKGDETRVQLLARMGWSKETLQQWRATMMDNSLQCTWGYCLTVHKCVHPDTLVETAEGLLPIRKIADEGVVGTPEGARRYSNKIENAEEEMLRIETEDGYVLRVTPEHGVDSWDGEAYARKEASTLKVGDFLRLRLGVTVEPEEVASLPPLPRGDVRAVKHVVPTAVTLNVAEFLGLMVGDGTLYERGFRLAKRHEDVADRFSELCSSLFGVTPKRFYTNNAYHVEVSSTLLSSWLYSVGGMCPNTKAVPESVLRSSSVVQAAFLRGLFEDGTVNVKKGVLDHVEWSSVFPELDNTVRVMLLRLGVICGYVIDNRSVKRLCIYGENAHRFRNAVGFVSAFKNERLLYPARKELRYRVPVGKEEASELFRKGLLTQYQKQNTRETGYLSRHVAAAVPEVAERLRWHHSRIQKIEKILAPSMCVEVPEGHQFLQDGFSGWNSQGSQYSEVGFISCPGFRKKEEHGGRLSADYRRRMTYTAVTRAESGFKAFIYGSPQ